MSIYNVKHDPSDAIDIFPHSTMIAAVLFLISVIVYQLLSGCDTLSGVEFARAFAVRVLTTRLPTYQSKFAKHLVRLRQPQG